MMMTTYVRPLFFFASAMSAMAIMGMGLPSCTLTLPFDTLTDGVPRGGPAPTSRYPLDETSGTTANDSVGSNIGVLNAQTAADLPKWTPSGKRGGALDFGLDGWVVVPGVSGPRFPQRATLVMWVRIRTYPPNNDETAIFDVSEADDDDATPLATYLTASSILFEASTVAPAGQPAPSGFVSTASVAENIWVLVASAWDIPGKQILLFARPDGKEPYPIQRGVLPPGFALKVPELYFYTQNGVIDDVRLYDRVLTDEELAALD